MPVPKKKTSKSKRDMRRAHDALSKTGTVTCSQCGEQKKLHHICDSCGTYRGKTVLNKEEN